MWLFFIVWSDSASSWYRYLAASAMELVEEVEEVVWNFLRVSNLNEIIQN